MCLQKYGCTSAHLRRVPLVLIHEQVTLFPCRPLPGCVAMGEDYPPTRTHDDSLLPAVRGLICAYLLLWAPSPFERCAIIVYCMRAERCPIYSGSALLICVHVQLLNMRPFVMSFWSRRIRRWRYR